MKKKKKGEQPLDPSDAGDGDFAREMKQESQKQHKKMGRVREHLPQEVDSHTQGHHNRKRVILVEVG